MALSKQLRSEYLKYFIFILSAVFLLSLSIFSLIWFQKQRDSAGWINHTYQVKLRIEKSFGSLLEAESNQRGFLLSKDSSFLEDIGHAERILNSSLHQLDSLVADNPIQIENLNMLKTLVQARIRRLHTVLDSSKNLIRTPLTPNASPGKIIMDSIHVQVLAMQASEDDLLKERTISKQDQDNRVFVFILLLAILAFAILMLSFFKINNESALRLKAQSNATLLENLVSERTAEIKKMNDLLHAQNQILERKNNDLTSFTSIASHDLKEPLRKIEMFTSRIRHLNPDYLTDKSFEYFEKIGFQANRMQNLIQSILQYAQADDDSYGFEKTDFNGLTNQAIENLNEIIQQKTAMVEVDPLPTLSCRPGQMEQVFLNLIDNGLKYARPGVVPHIKITANRLDKDGLLPTASALWKIDFADNGIGFDETYNHKIFEIFQRLHSNDEYPGTGIGLAICKKIIENHGGKILAKSNFGEGSVFSIILPAEA